MKLHQLLIPGTAGLFLLGALSGVSAQDPQSTSTESPADSAVAEAPPPVTEEEALIAMGYAMATQMRLDIGFTDAQLETILGGMRSYARGEERPEDFDRAVAAAQELYREKMTAAQEAERLRNEKLAEENKAKAEKFLAELNEEGLVTSPTGLRYVIIEEGDAENKPTDRDRVQVHYEGRLIDGTIFDSSYERGQPSVFATSGVVRGFSEGLKLVGKGGKVRLYIPSDLGYGNNPRPDGKIKPGDLLIFEVELLDVLKAPPVREGEAPGRPSGPPNMRPPGPPPGPPPSGPPPGPPPSRRPPSPPPSAPPTTTPGN